MVPSLEDAVEAPKIIAVILARFQATLSLFTTRDQFGRKTKKERTREKWEGRPGNKAIVE